MWARDFLIISNMCYPGELIRNYRCYIPSTPVSIDSNAIFVQLQGKERFGKPQAISVMSCYRADIVGKQAFLNFQAPSNCLKSKEMDALLLTLKQHYKRAMIAAETKALIATFKTI